jgi:hypothetical protein
MTTTQVTVTYCESWDPYRLEVSFPRAESTVRAQHAAGDPYAALLSVDGRPRAFVRIDTGHRKFEVACFDEAARRVLVLEFRDRRGYLELTGLRASLYAADDDWESEPVIAIAFEVRPDGRAEVSVQSEAGRRVTESRELPGSFYFPLPAFGEFLVDAGLLRIAGDLEFVVADECLDGVRAETTPVAHGAGPRQPDNLAAMLIKGAQFRTADGETATVWGLDEMGTLRLPTGKIVVTDACFFVDADPYTVDVPTGDHPVFAVVVERSDIQWEMMAALVVRFGTEPTVTWESALQPGEDERDLDAGAYFGVRCTGDVAVFDACATEVFREAARKHFTTRGSQRHELRGVEDPTAGATLFVTGIGNSDVYPVWIGRDADGGVTCLFLDMMVIEDAQLITPCIPGAARLPTHPVPVPLPASLADRFDSGPVLEFFGAETTRILGPDCSLPVVGARRA